MPQRLVTVKVKVNFTVRDHTSSTAFVHTTRARRAEQLAILDACLHGGAPTTMMTTPFVTTWTTQCRMI